MTQTDAIRSHLITRRVITPLDALNEYGCFRLAARIVELRREGLDIETVIEKRNGKRYARYILRGQAEMFG
jgi:hypothetical protein